MKKGIALISILLICVFGFGGCANTKPTTNLTLWSYYSDSQKAGFEKFVEQFNNTVGKQNNIVVSVNYFGNIGTLTKEIFKSANAQVGAKEFPDIAFAYSDTAFSLDKLGKIASLEGHFSASELDEYVGSFISEGRFDSAGNLKILPVMKATEVLMLNKTSWDKFKLAKPNITDESLATMEGIVRVSEEYYNWTDSATPNVANDGKAFFGRDSMSNYMLIGAKQLGVEIFSTAGNEITINLDKKAVRKLWDNFYLPYIKGYFFAKDKYASGDMKFENIVAMECSSTGALYFPMEVYSEEANSNKATPIEALVLPPPVFEGKDKIAVQQGAGIVVAKTNKERESACVQFIKWLSSADVNANLALRESYMPVKKVNLTEDKISLAAESLTLKTKDVIKQSILQSAKVVKDFALYNNKPFANSYEARAVFDDKDSKTFEGLGMHAKAQRDRLIVIEKLKTMSLADAVNEVNTTENFNAWYNSVLAKLNEVKASV